MYVFGLTLSRSNKNRQGSRSIGAATNRAIQIGPFTLAPPNSQVPRNIQQGRQRSLFCLINAASINAFLPRTPHWHEEKLWSALDLGRCEFEWVLRSIHEEMRSERFGTATMIESLTNMLAIKFIRRLELADAGCKQRIGGLSPWRMNLLNERMSGDGAMPSIAELADLCGLTERHLCRAFKAETSRTLGQYVDAAMAKRARAMLCQTTLTLAEISRRLGFATSSSFANAFQRVTGVKPGMIERPLRSSAQ
jgi:AraC family transcriptional regulator